MSQSIRRTLVAMSVASALLLAVPASSWAAQTRKPAPEHTLGLMAQAWSWLESLLGDPRPQAGAQSKDIMTSPPPATNPLPPSSQGPAIDPNGAK
ncbi:MAG: hypothetical protein DMF53_21295 [Acidobacteria bacterium]|nr:MAG: hypothetical protein DMF53_21295 [Acidobacteriota bacterium]